MTTKQPYPDEFKIEAVKQITERGHKVAEVSARIGVSQHSLYKWIKVAVPSGRRRLVLATGRRLVDGQPHRHRPGARRAVDALWRRQPRNAVIVHSDQGSQFTGHERQSFVRDHNLVSSMSRRGNCHDNAVAESFFQLLKRERIRRQIYATRSDARADVFNYIEMFHNPKRRHSSAAGVSPVEFEQRHSQRLESV